MAETSPECRFLENLRRRADQGMKGKSFHLVGTTETARRRRRHADPEDMKRLLAGGLEPKDAKALRRHLRSCLDCALLAGRLAAIQGVDLERTS